MNTQDLIGILLSEHQQRDAIHIAVVSVEAHMELKPGQKVQLLDGNKVTGVDIFDISTGRYIGVVDPFLKHPVGKGDIFWMFLLPNTITSLRHNWTHPAFRNEEINDNNSGNPVAEEELRSFAVEHGMEYEDLIDRMTEANEQGYANIRGDLDYDEREKNMWVYFEAVTGIRVPEEHRSFSCSC